MTSATPYYSSTLRTVGVGRRAGGFLIDIGIFYLFFCCFGGIIAVAAGDTSDPSEEDAYNLAFGLFFFGWFIALILYFLILEATSGQTLGKKLVGIRVVREDGTPIGFSKSLIRNILRIVDGLFNYLVGAIFVWTSERHQRLGDRAAGTIVVWDKASQSPQSPPATRPPLAY